MIILGFEPFANESVTNIAYHQIEMLEDWRCGSKVEIIHLSNGQAEIDQLVVTAVETGKNGIMIVDPSLDIILHVEVHHA